MDPIQHPSEPTSHHTSDPGAAADSKIQVTSPSERRGQRRAKTDLFVNRFLNGHPYLCRMTNISRSGARLVPIIEPRLTPAPLFMGLQFQLPGRPEVVTASGQAVTTDDGRAVGIRFTRLPPAAASAIDALTGESSAL
jgi:PilZ domain